MAHKSIGIEICSNILKAVVIESGFRGFKILQGIYAPFSSEEQGSIVNLLQKTFSEIIETTDVVSVQFPGERTFFQNIHLPFRDSKKIESTLPFEIMGAIPLNVEEIHSDYEIYEERQNSVYLLSGAVFIKEFEEFLSLFKSAGIEPKVISAGGMALSALSEYFPSDQAFLIANFKSDRVDIAIFDRKKIVMLRTCKWAKNEISLEDVVREIQSSVLLFSEEYKKEIEKIWICGEIEDEKIEFLKKELAFEVEGIEKMQFPIEGIEEINERQRELSFALSLALRGLRPTDRRKFNLRRGLYAYEGEMKFLREKLKYLVLFLVFVFTFIGVKTCIKYEGLKKEKENLYGELKSYTKEVIGQEFEGFERALSTMKGIIKEDVRILPEWSAVDTFYKITNALEEAMSESSNKEDETFEEGYILEIENVKIEPYSAFVRGEANTIEAFEKYIEKLKKTQCFKDVITENTERINFQRHLGWQRFSIKINIECREEKKEEKPKKKEV